MKLIAPALAILVAFAGCLNPAQPVEPSSSTLPAADPAVITGPITEEIAGDIQFSAATPARSFNSGGTFVQAFTPAANISGFVFEVTWEAATPASQELSMWVRQAGVGAIDPTNPNLVMPPGNVAQVDGSSPLRLALAADQFPEEGDYEVVVRASASPAGVAANQPFTLYLTTFLEVPFDPEYTALAQPEA